MSASVATHHTEWLALVEYQGPFLTLPVLKRALPQGLEATSPELARDVRLADEDRRADSGLHHRWVRWVLETVLDLDGQVIVEGPAVPGSLQHRVGEHGVTLRPDLAVLDPGQDGRARLLVRVLPAGVAVDQQVADDRWAATPRERMVELCRAAGVRLGLVTNGDTWALVDAPRGAPPAFAIWEAGMWTEERITLDAFRTLLGAHRFFAVAETDTLEALFAESVDAEEEVTEQLGHQVREAVELLVDAFSGADRDARGKLLGDLEPEHVYLAAVTVMMRVVFLLSAEERGLLPLGERLYQASYAVSTLRGQLREQADRHGEEPLERRSSAWHRLLALFRMVHAGVAHENLRLPAYGGGLFDPDRFPFLEGRRPGEAWEAVPGRPLPVDDRTMLHVLDAVQVLRFRRGRGVTEARRLSFRTLGVEQIGHVYEGLLDHTAKQAQAPVLGFAGKREAELAAEEVARYDTGERDAFVDWLKDQTGLTKRQVEKRLDPELDPQDRALLLAACDNDERIAVEIEPYAGLLRRDLRGLPQVWLPGRMYVTGGAARRSTGTYYTPKVLAEEMVHHTLEPLCYQPGPAVGADPDDWQLRPARELLDLRVCDMAMGSGAFLVAACRYLGDRLVEAWDGAAREVGGEITLLGEPAADAPDAEVVPADPEDRKLLAKRVVADRCLFGVDKNPMAVDMAKLSMWLLTLARDRPFSFLDHALRCGDSLLGITDLAQLEYLHPDPALGRALHEGTLFDYQSVWAPVLKDAIAKRLRLESFTVVTVADAEEKARLHREADEALGTLRIIGDVVIGAAIASAGKGDDFLDGKLLGVAEDVAMALDPDVPEPDRQVRLTDLRTRAAFWLDTDRPQSASERTTFHWPLEFPEIFLDRPRLGFDAIVGNPPFLGGTKISGPLGPPYRQYLGKYIAGRRTDRADLAAFFFLRAAQVGNRSAGVGLLATNTIAQGDTRDAALTPVVTSGWKISRAIRSRPWPGSATLEISQVWLHRQWHGTRMLDGALAPDIAPSLDVPRRVPGVPKRLAENGDLSFQGSKLDGVGFLLSPQKAQQLIDQDPRNRDVLVPYLGGEDVNTRPDVTPSRWAINFYDWPLERVEQYPQCLKIVRERVKPVRDKHLRRGHRERWWHYGDKRPHLYRKIRDLDRVLAITSVSKTVLPVLVPTGWTYSHALFVFAFNNHEGFGVMSCAFHWWWTAVHASTLETRIRYTPTDCFDPFPQPTYTAEVRNCGKALDDHRRALMLSRQEGLTRTYNRLHDPEEASNDIVELRRLHVDLDYSVASAYGWSDLNLAHGFWPTRQGIRYTIGEPARTEVLDRLLELNRARYEEEVRQGLHDRRAKPKRRQAPGQLWLE